MKGLEVKLLLLGGKGKVRDKKIRKGKERNGFI